jgi:hypothetical protein
MVPPAAYCIPLPRGFGATEMTSPDADLSLNRLMIANEIAAVTTADPMIPYMRND